MIHHCLPTSSFSVTSPPALPQKCAKRIEHDVFRLDAFVSAVYLPHIRHRKRSPQVDERIARQHISPAFGDRRLADIECTEVEGWLHGLSVQGLAPATCNRILAVFKSICSFAAIHGLFPAGQSPCAGVPPFKTRTARERYLTQ